MIRITSTPETRPVTLQEALAFLGLPIDQPDDVVENLLNSTINDVERALGVGVGISEVTASVYWPFPSRLLLPYAPLTQDETGAYDLTVTSIDEVAGTELECDADDFIVRNSAPAVVFPRYVWPSGTCLKFEYSGGYETLPTEIKALILRTVAARWEARSTTLEPDVVPVTEEGYLAVWR